MTRSTADRLGDLETAMEVINVWVTGQKVRNRFRAATFVSILVVCAALTASLVYLVFVYLPDRRTAGDERSKRVTYAACVALRNVPNYPDAEQARDILNCDLVLQGPPPVPNPTGPTK